MASPAAILRSARATPGAVPPTYPPQGGSPWIGQLPSYSMEPGSGYSRGFGNFLPRPPETFTQGAFGPMAPILPVPINMPPEGFDRPQPRRWQPYVGYNLPVGVPGSEGYKLASFPTLKTLSETYSILRTCLERRKDEIRSLNWTIALTPEAANAYQGDTVAMRDFGERQAKAIKFFKRPDSDYEDFGSWLHALTDQLFVYDAVSVYLCPKKGRGLRRGLLGSDLDELWLIDGSSIRPLVGLQGERPRPPAPCYSQFEFGVPRADLTTIIAGLDLDGSEGSLRALLRGDQLTYRPYLRRPDSPYGFSLVEQAIIPIMTGLRKQAAQLDYYNESTVPRVYISPGESAGYTANQLREMQDALNAVAGDYAWAFKIQVIPPGSKVMPQKEMQIVDQADEWIANEVAMACGIAPTEIGLIPTVSTVASPFAAREMAQAARSVHERTATKPTLAYLAAIPDMILQQVCGCEDMRFVFEGMEQTQDLAALTDIGIKQVQSGVKTIDEFRDDLHMTRFNLEETKNPVVFTPMGPILLTDAAALAQAQRQQTGTAAVGEGQRAAPSGPRKMLPPGTSGQGRMNGPVTQRQARRGGALAPAHATGEGAPGHSGGKPAAKAADVPGSGGSQGPFEAEYGDPHVYARDVHSGAGNCVCGGAPSDDIHVVSPLAPAKAALAELEALGRHLRKGMLVAEWVPVHLDGTTMAIIADDLSKGLSAAQVIGQARDQVTKAQTPAQRQAAQQAAARQQMAALAAQFQAQVAAAFGAALASAGAMIAAWIAGTLAVTAAVLAGMIAEAIRRALIPVLTALWTAAWDAAVREAGGDPARYQADLEAFLATEGANWASLIAGTGEAALLAAIRQAILAGDVSAILGRLRDVLNVDQRAEMIATSEVTRAWSAAFLLVLKAAGVAYKTWITRNDAKVCAICLANQEQGVVPIDSLFKSGHMAPPGHTRCRCHPGIGYPVPNVTGKVLRREIGLNGQETWTEWEPGPDYSGGRVFQPHLSDGTMIPGTIPVSAFPRWDGSEPYPVVERAPDADDSAAYGDHDVDVNARPGTYWPAPYMDGWWPAPHGHGTEQAPSSSPGSRTGRPPNPAGKAAKGGKAAAFLKDAPRAKPADVRAVMRKNFPASALRWVGRIRWVGPVDIPIDLVDTSSEGEWAAAHEQAHVDRIASDMRAGKDVNPIIGLVRVRHNRVRMVDGRHRLRASEQLGHPVRGYVGFITEGLLDQALDTYHQQFHAGDSPQNKGFTAGVLGDGSVSGLVPFNLQQGQKLTKAVVNYRPAADLARSCGTCSMLESDGSCSLVEGNIATSDVCDRWEPAGLDGERRRFAEGVMDRLHALKTDGTGPSCAGLLVRAQDTGRVLLIQRAITDTDPAAGFWELPGGHADDGESLLAAALREWSEEVGVRVPAGQITGRWASPNGIYEAFVMTVPRETDIPIDGPRDEVANPDGDAFEAVAWWEPRLLGGNPALRPELQADLPLVLAAIQGETVKSARGRTSAEVLREYWTHTGHPGPTQYALEEKIRWGEPHDWYRCVDELTPYIGAEGAKGYCNLRHHEVLGVWPGHPI